MEPVSRELTGADGNLLHLLEWSREGVPLLLLHGYGNEAHIWDETSPLLAPHYRVLALDLRGHGDSAHDPERRYPLDHHLRDLEAALPALGIERLVLVGHSFGGRVALLFAARHPARCAGLVVVDTGPEHDPRGTGRIKSEVMARAERGDGSFARVEEYERVLARNYPAGDARALRRMAAHELRRRADGRFERKLDPLFLADEARGSADAQQGFESELGQQLWRACEQLRCPTLVVRGAASDVLSAEVADKMTETISDGRLAVIPQAAHSVMTDNPKAFGEAVCDFVLG